VREPVTITSDGAPVVFISVGDGWAAILYPGPTAFGDTPEDALRKVRTQNPEAWAAAAMTRRPLLPDK
jgi:hypothetical protein